MGIPLWREVRYTDDGCSIYQCLSCKASWEGRGAPGYYHWETGEYHVVWKFCPLCAVEWTGARFTGSDHCEGHPEFGPRRQRIKDAIQRRYDAAKEAHRANDHRGPYPEYPGAPPDPPFWWIIEKRFQSFFWKNDKFDPDAPWEVCFKLRGLAAPAKMALDDARHEFVQQLADRGPDKWEKWEDPIYNFSLETRVRMVKAAEYAASDAYKRVYTHPSHRPNNRDGSPAT